MKDRIVNRNINPRLESLPLKFESFYRQQIEAVAKANEYFDAGERFVFLDAPTGTGKTVMGEAIGRMVADRRQYMCTTKSLQDQFVDDFPYACLLKGRANYPTGIYPKRFHPDDNFGTHLSCSECTYTKDKPSCKWCVSKARCPYEIAKRDALHAELAVINTAYFLAEANGVGRLAGWSNSLIIVDEADTLESQLMNYVSVDISERRRIKYKLPLVDHGTSKGSWAEWLDMAIAKLMKTAEQYTIVSGDVREIREFNYLVDTINKLRFIRGGLDDGYWVYDGAGNHDRVERREKRIVFRPSHVRDLGEDYFWKHGERFLCMSATPISCDEIAQSTGMPGQFAVVKLDSPFPIENRRVYYKGVADMAKKNAEASWPKIAEATRAILNKHPNDRVLVHTVSYALTKYLVAQLSSGTTRPIISYESANGRETALSMFQSTPGSVCLAPSFERGVDLKDELCRVQIIVKCPFPYLDRVTNARLHSPGGENWYLIQTIRAIVQMCGRAVRHKEDFAATYVLDTQFEGRVWSSGRGLFPSWFSAAIDWRSERQ